MRILHASTHETAGGASIAAMRLHKGLLEQEVRSHVVVLNKEGGAPNVSLLGGRFMRRILRPVVQRIEAGLLDVAYSRPQHLGYSTFSIALSWSHAWLNRLPKDILHLHWVGEGFLTPFSLGRLSGPVVWTMHDTFAFTGGCHFTSTGCVRYFDMCGQCPELCSGRSVDLSRLHWLLKRRAISRIQPVIVSPSREYARRARASGMLKDCRIEVIPNGVDLDVFRPIDKGQARALLRLPHDVKLVCFGAISRGDNGNKGLDILVEALRILNDRGGQPYAAVIFGDVDPGVSLPCAAYFLGRLQDSLTLALAYSVADVFVCPSRQENLPNTIMEAMACGVPVAAFSVGGISDLVQDGVTGKLAVPEDPNSLADAIDFLLGDDGRRRVMGDAAREKIEMECSIVVVAEKYTKLYEDVLISQERK